MKKTLQSCDGPCSVISFQPARISLSLIQANMVHGVNWWRPQHAHFRMMKQSKMLHLLQELISRQSLSSLNSPSSKVSQRNTTFSRPTNQSLSVAFLMAVWRFTACRGTPAELYSDQGTNLRGGEKEFREAFSVMSPNFQGLLAKHQINFHFNPPAAPHVGGVWE